MSDGHLCTRWFERNLRCPFDGELWHELSYDPDDFDWDEYLDYSGLGVPAIAFTNMGYMVYGSILLEQQKALKTKTTLGANLNVAPFTSTGGYLAMVEASEIAVATRVARGNTPKGLAATETSSTQRPGLSVGSAAQVIIWSTAIALAFAGTRGRGPGAPGVAIATARVMPPEILAWIANFGKSSPGIIGETVLLANLASSWLYQTNEDYKIIPKRLSFDPHGQEVSEIGVI
jgi:hypothetical protein